ncbi:SRPBCC family protein [Streptomyces sp. NPDC048717]|uniref:SRPBCC family protein n=1 Tax=Streptomyces sp. NPDC048717 TaxID=3154928 RepID=UPI003413B9E1
MHEMSHGRPDIHWPAGFSPDDAHDYDERQALVRTPVDRAFELLTEVSHWPDWSPGVGAVSSEGQEQFFHVQWHGHKFEIFVGENEPPYRIGWLGIGAGVQLYQAWVLTPTEEGTRLVTANIVRSAAPKSLDVLSGLWMDRLSEVWHAQIARVSEA